MELSLRIILNEKLYLKNPEESLLGRKIVTEGLKLINTLGYFLGSTGITIPPRLFIYTK